MFSCVSLHLLILLLYIVLRHCPLINASYFRALMYALFLILVSIPENNSYFKQRLRQQENVTNFPWIQNSVVYTQRFHHPKMNDKIAQRSLSYRSNVVGKERLDVANYMWKELGDSDVLDSNLNEHVFDPWNISRDEHRMFSSMLPFDDHRERSLTYNSPAQHLATNPDLNDVFDYMYDEYMYEEYDDRNTFKNRLYNLNQPKMSDRSSGNTKLNYKIKEPSTYRTKEKQINPNSRNVKSQFKDATEILEDFTHKVKNVGESSLKNIQRLVKNQEKTYNMIDFHDQNQLIDRLMGPVIASHVVTTSIHPWIVPFLFTMAEPYISFIVFLIITIIELFGIGVGSGFALFGLGRTQFADSLQFLGLTEFADSLSTSGLTQFADTLQALGLTQLENTLQNLGFLEVSESQSLQSLSVVSASSSAALVIDPCASVTCSGTSDTCVNGVCKCGSNAACTVTGETCSSGACKCGSANSCSGSTSAPYCDASNNVCKCSASVAACSGTTDTCDSGTCKCGTGSACSVSGETCSSGTCKCGSASSCSGQSTGAYCDASNNVCKCSADVAACSSGQECTGSPLACEGKSAIFHLHFSVPCKVISIICLFLLSIL